MGLNLATILRGTAQASPDRVAIRLGDAETSYADLDRAAAGIASALRAGGLQPGERVALMIPNLPEFTQAYYGVLYAGGVVIPLNVLLSPPEVQYHLEDAGAKKLIAHPLFEAAAAAGAQLAGVEVIWAAGEGEGTVAGLAAADPIASPHQTASNDTAVILYTSGTTGKPKGAELTHQNLFTNAVVVVPKLGKTGPDDVALATLPLFHSFGQTCMQNATLAQGGTVTLLPRFTPAEAFEIMERDRVTIFAGVPTMYFALLHHESEKEHDLSSLRLCMSGGAPMPVEVMKAFEGKFGLDILEGYGLSETSPVASFTLPDRPRKPGSIGYPVWGVELAILDDDHNELPDGERGEICIRGHNVMKGYLNRPDATAEALRDGWFHTGDIGVRDEDGCFTIVDRKKDMILRGGFNVYPREVEEVLYAHEGIVEAAVIGVPDESHGEEVKAVVVAGPGVTLDSDEVKAWCKERLASYKYPRLIEVVAELPKGPTGKILKRELS